MLSKNNNHVLYGVKPTNPSTEYGYIETKTINNELVITNFIEKPALDKAKELYAKDNYYWNNGIMLTTKELIFNSIKEIMPTQYELLDNYINNVIDTNKYF